MLRKVGGGTEVILLNLKGCVETLRSLSLFAILLAVSNRRGNRNIEPNLVLA